MQAIPVPDRASCRPEPALVPFIDRMWCWAAPATCCLPPLLPGTGAECFVHLERPFLIDGHQAPVAHVLCNRTRTLRLVADGPIRLLAVRFRAGQLRHFVSAAFHELQDRIVPAADLWSGTSALHDQLSALSDFPAQARLLSTFFGRQLRERRQHQLDTLLNRLYYAPNTRIETLAQAAGWSRRNLNRRFAALFGVTPKHFARVARLQQVARMLALNPDGRLLDQALDAGYFDQAHFCHDLRALTGLSPRGLRTALAARSHFYNPPTGEKRSMATP